MTSEHDQAVLNSIFNPYLPLGEGVVFGSGAGELQQPNDHDLNTEITESNNLEVEGVKKAEAGDLKNALVVLTSAVSLSPQRASAYNNRAQVYRLLNNDSAALDDLSRALTLSEGKGRVAVQALCQRGLIHRKREDNDSARADFQAAAALGSDFAKQQLVEMNPYAAMCNQMLRQVFSELQTPSEPV